MKYVLVLDVGTTGVKAILYTEVYASIGKAYETYPVFSPQKDWVEQSPQTVLNACIRVLKKVLHEQKIESKQIKSIGITNQRETTILWDRVTGKPLYPAIVWEDLRTRKACRAFTRHTKRIREKTGLKPDPYFSATKIHWILENIPEASKKLRNNRLCFGTIDTWLLFNLCNEKPHATDRTNAARTLLCNIHTGEWDNELLELFHIPYEILPSIQPTRSFFGTLKTSILGRDIPIIAVCGDQQSSFFAAKMQSKRKRAITKITYGTGVFLSQSIPSFALSDDFFTTIVPSEKNELSYALEAKICISGPEVTKRLNHPKQLKTYFYQLAKQIDRKIKKLPVQPKELLIDGGSSRDGLVTAIQEEVSEIPTQPLVHYDGTALGTALLQGIEIKD